MTPFEAEDDIYKAMMRLYSALEHGGSDHSPVYTENSYLKDIEMSVRLHNVLNGAFTRSTGLPPLKQLKIGHFKNVTISHLLGLRHFGMKSLREIQLMCLYAGIIIPYKEKPDFCRDTEIDYRGKRIYENDVIREWISDEMVLYKGGYYSYSVIKMHQGSWCVCGINYEYKDPERLWDRLSDDFEICGSIFDHPELSKEGTN